MCSVVACVYACLYVHVSVRLCVVHLCVCVVYLCVCAHGCTYMYNK